MSSPRPPEGDWLGTPYLRFERQGSVAVVTVDRPEKRNALTGAMYFGIRHALGVVNNDESLRGMLITGVADVFIPGGDLSRQGVDQWLDFSSLGMDVTPFTALRRSAKPVVSAVNGICQGGGMMIAMCSDLAVASNRATFRAPELLRGIADMYYAAILPAQIGPARAKDMLLFARTATAQEAVDWGLVSRMVPHDQLMDAAFEALEQAFRCAPVARAHVKRGIDEHYDNFDAMTMGLSLAHEESAEGFLSFKERRAPSWSPTESESKDR